MLSDGFWFDESSNAERWNGETWFDEPSNDGDGIGAKRKAFLIFVEAFLYIYIWVWHFMSWIDVDLWSLRHHPPLPLGLGQRRPIQLRQAPVLQHHRTPRVPRVHRYEVVPRPKVDDFRLDIRGRQVSHQDAPKPLHRHGRTPRAPRRPVRPSPLAAPAQPLRRRLEHAIPGFGSTLAWTGHGGPTVLFG